MGESSFGGRIRKMENKGGIRGQMLSNFLGEQLFRDASQTREDAAWKA
jgi:hypothetical protein